jgi:hypothetical protein
MMLYMDSSTAIPCVCTSAFCPGHNVTADQILNYNSCRWESYALFVSPFASAHLSPFFKPCVRNCCVLVLSPADIASASFLFPLPLLLRMVRPVFRGVEDLISLSISTLLPHAIPSILYVNCSVRMVAAKPVVWMPAPTIARPPARASQNVSMA